MKSGDFRDFFFEVVGKREKDEMLFYRYPAMKEIEDANYEFFREI